MLGLAEYRAAAAQVERLGQQYDQQLAEALRDIKNKQEAIKIARQIVAPYQAEYEGLLRRTLHQIAFNASSKYIDDLGLSTDASELATALVDKQYTSKYYGYTLDQRLNVVNKRLNRAITQRGNVAVDRIPGVFSSGLPGSQMHIDRRLLQGTTVKVERDTAFAVAEDADIPLIRWRLSPRHTKACACEEYAKKGLFKREELPDPPHPNCQCEFELVTATKSTRPGPIKRVLRAVRNLIQQLRGK